ncbi:hypothetical protein D3C81_2124410 [compost metagenome]
MLLGEIKHALANTAFGLKHDLFADRAVHMNCFGKDLFARASAIDIRMIEEVGAFLECSLNEALGLRFIQ